MKDGNNMTKTSEIDAISLKGLKSMNTKMNSYLTEVTNYLNKNKKPPRDLNK